ncbi:hypothetical protein EDC04DRAFT_2605475 [Pisolithus marmoratus]|nr:hypothetical protein EDC04DRAFT_2605475 [Pisolithus marmoratus]
MSSFCPVEIGLLYDIPYASCRNRTNHPNGCNIVLSGGTPGRADPVIQVGVAKLGQEIDVWVLGLTRVRLKVGTSTSVVNGSSLSLKRHKHMKILKRLFPHLYGIDIQEYVLNLEDWLGDRRDTCKSSPLACRCCLVHRPRSAWRVLKMTSTRSLILWLKSVQNVVTGLYMIANEISLIPNMPTTDNGRASQA